MYKKYAIVRCAQDLNDIDFRNPLIKYFPKKFIARHIIKKLPLNISKTTFLGNEGLEIKLPIIPEGMNDEEDYVKAIIRVFNKRILIYNINVIVVSEELEKYKNDFELLIANEKHVQFLYIDKIIRKLINCINKELKDMNFVIIDGDNSKTRYIIDNIYRGINSLTIVTSRPEIFEETVEEIYQETGLAVQISNNNVNQEIASDIIINCNHNKDKVFYCLNEGSYIIDFISDDDKIKNIMIKRSDINIVTGIDMYVNNHLMSKDLFHGILLNENRMVRSMYLYGYRNNMLDRLNNIKNKYNVRIGKMYQRGEELQRVDKKKR